MKTNPDPIKSFCNQRALVVTVSYGHGPLFPILANTISRASRNCCVHSKIVQNTPIKADQDTQQIAASFEAFGLSHEVVSCPVKCEHGEALDWCISQSTDFDYLIVVDPDFFVVQPMWLDRILEKFGNEGLVALGSQWHPRWIDKWAGLSPHFLVLDARKIDVSNLSFKRRKPAKRPLSRLLLFAGKRRRIGSSRDTGYLVHQDISAKYEGSYDVLQVHATIDHLLCAGVSMMALVLDPVFPRTWRFRRPTRDVVAESSLATQAHLAGIAYFEVFHFEDRPFAIHLRGRKSGPRGQSRPPGPIPDREYARAVQFLPTVFEPESE